MTTKLRTAAASLALLGSMGAVAASAPVAEAARVAYVETQRANGGYNVYVSTGKTAVRVQVCASNGKCKTQTSSQANKHGLHTFSMTGTYAGNGRFNVKAY